MSVITDIQPLETHISALADRADLLAGGPGKVAKRYRSILATLQEFWPFYGQLNPDQLESGFFIIGNSEPVDLAFGKQTTRHATCAEIAGFVSAAYKTTCQVVTTTNLEACAHVWTQLAESIPSDADGRHGAIRGTAKRETKMLRDAIPGLVRPSMTVDPVAPAGGAT